MTDKCTGENCTSIDGFNHSLECLFEHFTAYTGAHREPIDVLRKIKKAYFDGYEAAATAQQQSQAVIEQGQARIAELEALIGVANTILEIGESINPGCVLHSEIKAALAKKELSE